MYILSIESSCDEFSVSIAKDDQILSNVISSQIDEHVKFGGVVPELASRLHLQNFHWVLKSAIEEAGVNLNEINYISYTANPGLIGSLIIGKLVAETLANYLNIPLMPMNHIEGHIYGANIENKFEYPVLALVVSGGHTQLEYIDKPLNFNIIGRTQDDAIGECYDKVARVIGLGYPGGPKIDKNSIGGDSSRYKLPMPKNDQSFDFSFSGLKTASINLIHKHKQNNEEINIVDFCASFQKTAVDTVINKLEMALNKYKPKTLTIAGGVSANTLIRSELISLGKRYNINIVIPKMEYCTDNAAMIAALTYEYINNNKH